MKMEVIIFRKRTVLHTYCTSFLTQIDTSTDTKYSHLIEQKPRATSKNKLPTTDIFSYIYKCTQ